jgi:hypothetical protein
MVKTKESQIYHIMGKYWYISKTKLSVQENREQQLNTILGKKTKKIPVFYSVGTNTLEYKERMRVFEYFYKLGKDDDYIAKIWQETHRLRRKDTSEFNLKPIRERKDNQHPENYGINWGSGCGSSNRIRVPSKKHKNRYKNFLKLFPNYKP